MGSFNDLVENYNLKIITIDKINAKKENQNKEKINNLTDVLFKEIYNIYNTINMKKNNHYLLGNKIS
mgnify:CR=1 FL=1